LHFAEAEYLKPS